MINSTRIIKIKYKNEKFKVNNTKRVIYIQDKGFEIYLNIEINNHVYYNKFLFNEIEFIRYNKIIE